MQLIQTVVASVCMASTVASGVCASTDAFALYSAGIDGIFHDAKDTGFHQALVRLETHPLSLPDGMTRNDRREIQTMLKLLLSELDVRVAMRPDAGPNEIPFTLRIHSRGNEGAPPATLVSAAQQMAPRGTHGVPDAQYPGFLRYNDDDPDPPTWIGLDKVNGVETAVLSVGAPPASTDLDWSPCGLPDGSEVVAGLLIDFNELQSLVGMAMMAQPQVGGLLKQWGLIGPDALRVQFAVGRHKDQMHFGGRVAHWAKHFGQYEVDGGVRASDLDCVPKDAVAAQITRANIRALLHSLIDMGDSMMPPLGRGPDGEPVVPSEMASQQIKMMFGVNPKTELIDYLGDAVTIYRANSTGGGGLMSTVMLVEASNPDGLATSIGLLAARANSMAGPMSEGHVHMATWTHADCGEVISLTFPGLPIPVELCIAVKENWLVTTLTPQAMIAACRQFDTRSSLRQAKNFRQSVGSKGIGVMQVSYADTPSQIAEGYGYMVGIASAISNYSRPTDGQSHLADLVVPVFGDLAEDVQPCAMLVTVDDGDLLYQGTADPSMSVLMTSMMASINSSMLLPMMSGVAVPAVMEAQDTAMRARANAMRRAQEREDMERAMRLHEGWEEHAAPAHKGHDHDTHDHVEEEDKQ